jgi:hypothetical protein
VVSRSGCNNLFVTRMTRLAGAKRSIAHGLGRVEPEDGTAVAYTARHDTTAMLARRAATAPFSEARLGRIEEPASVSALEDQAMHFLRQHGRDAFADQIAEHEDHGKYQEPGDQKSQETTRERHDRCADVPQPMPQ